MDPMASLPPFMRDRMAAADRAEAAAWEMEQNDRREAAWDQAQRMAYNERLFEYMHGTDRRTWNLTMARTAAAREQRDASADYGSVNRAAIFIDGQELRPREQASGPVTMRADSIPAQLARAREVKRSATVLAMVDELERRQGGGKPAISRSQDTGAGADCLHCLEVGASPAESYLLHSDPELPPLPYGRVPDHPPQRSTRARSGTGWPELVR